MATSCTRHSERDRLEFALTPPTVEAPEAPAEEDRSADVDAERIAQLVSAPGIAFGINRLVGAPEQRRPRQGHQRSVQETA